MGRLLAVFLWPLAEIAVFAAAGQVIGVAGVLLAVILGVVAGMAVLRRSGRRAFDSWRRGAAGSDPGALRDAAEEGWMALAGALLIIPGFISDAVALTLLIGPVRRWLVRQGRKPMAMGSFHIVNGGFSAGGFTASGGSGVSRPPPPGSGTPLIEGEFHELGSREIEDGPA